MIDYLSYVRVIVRFIRNKERYRVLKFQRLNGSLELYLRDTARPYTAPAVMMSVFHKKRIVVVLIGLLLEILKICGVGHNSKTNVLVCF